GRTVQGDLTRIRDYYGYRGYAVGVSEAIYEVPEQPGIVRVHYQVEGDGGPPARVGRVILEGNTVTQDRVIMNQLDLRPGQILQYPEVEAARIRLARLGIFDPAHPPDGIVENDELDEKIKAIRVRGQRSRT